MGYQNQYNLKNNHKNLRFWHKYKLTEIEKEEKKSAKIGGYVLNGNKNGKILMKELIC